MAHTSSPARLDVVTRLLASGIAIDDSALTCSLYAYDASNYRIQPIAVAFPRSAEDVSLVMRACAAAGISVTARGAGTGMAGNSIGRGLVLDFRRFMQGDPRVDPIARTARVAPGIVLDDLQAVAAAHGLMFGPDPSSHSRATLGGMIGNDACGNHSVAYGRTSDHVLELELVLADGTRAVADRHGIRAHDPADSSMVEHIAEQLRSIASSYEDALRSELARSPRQVSGYAAQRVLPEHGFDIARLLVGSEGTLAIVVGATLQLVDAPREKQLLVLGYSSLIDAARDVPRLLTFSPSAIEAIDEAIVETMRLRRGADSVPSLPDGKAWLFVEFANTVAAADPPAVARELLSTGNAVSSLVPSDASSRSALWRVREDGAGLASNLADGTRGKPGWEDAAVPPDRLADYLEGLTRLQRQHGFHGVLYGHFGAGCVHIRFDFDTTSDVGRSAMRAFIRDAAKLVAACGGSVSGEHGDGRARGELLELMYSESALACFAGIKRAFDPRGVLNPGVIVDAPALTVDMPAPQHTAPATFALPEDHGDLAHAVARCVGIGRCVAVGATSMCPTFSVTHNEQDSTRGRARALQDLFNGTALTGADALLALDTCLSCKSCATECPTGVDMATYKAEFLNEHYRRRLRPRSHYSLGWLPVVVARSAPIASLINVMLATPPLRRAVSAILGLSGQRRFPTLATRARRERLQQLASPQTPRALIYADPLTQAFDPEVVLATAAVLARAEIPVQVVLAGDTGLTWITTGQLDMARKKQRELLDVFDALPADIPVIVPEPSCAATLAHDLTELVNDERGGRLAARVRTFTQALEELAPEWQLPAQFPRHVVMQPHCHEHATFTQASQADWLRERGVGVTEAVGCCGMGGNFGFEPGHESLSVAVAQRSLIPAIDAAHPTTVVLADGFGCRCQITDIRPEARPRHLAQVLAKLL